MTSDVANADSAVRSGISAEHEMVERAQKCPEAFGPLYDRYYSKILGYIYRRTLDPGLAEELTSNTFFHALRTIAAYEHRGHFSAWLYRIATNEINAHRRKASRTACNNRHQTELERVWFEPAEHDTEDDVKVKMQSFTRLHAAVGQLPENYQEAISLRYFEAMSHAEVAEVLGKRLGTIKSLIHRGVKLLRQRYQHERQEEDLQQ